VPTRWPIVRTPWLQQFPLSSASGCPGWCEGVATDAALLPRPPSHYTPAIAAPLGGPAWPKPPPPGHTAPGTPLDWLPAMRIQPKRRMHRAIIRVACVCPVAWQGFPGGFRGDWGSPRMSVFELTNLQAYIAIGASCRVQGAQCVCAMPEYLKAWRQVEM